MSKRIITFLYLLPLAILISLPCSIKQDIKQLLGVPVNTSVEVVKSNNPICVYTPAQNKKSGNKKQKLNVRYIFKQIPLYSFAPTGIVLLQSICSDLGNFSSVPIFLIYRKLII